MTENFKINQRQGQGMPQQSGRESFLNLFQQAKVNLNFHLDRLIDWADDAVILADSPLATQLSLRQQVACYLGDAALSLKFAPHSDVYRLDRDHASVICIGSEKVKNELKRILFVDKPQEIKLGRTALWHVSRSIPHWLEDVDLVVFEHSRWQLWLPQTRYYFSIRPWLRQILDISVPREVVISRMHSERRRHWRKMGQMNYTYKFTRRREDFDLFYHTMYLPYISARHNDRASISPYEIYKLYLNAKQGGLILIYYQEQPVAGVLSRAAEGVCHVGPLGVCLERIDLLDRELMLAIYWSTVEWAWERELKMVDWHHSRAWQADGVFRFKRYWGTQIVVDLQTHERWSFLANRLSLGLLRQLNQQGFITEMDGQHYSVLLLNEGEWPPDLDLERHQRVAHHDGLADVLVISPGRCDRLSQLLRKAEVM